MQRQIPPLLAAARVKGLACSSRDALYKSPDCPKQPGLVCAVKAGEVLCPLFLFQIDQIAILVDLNLARFHRFGNLAHQIDM